MRLIDADALVDALMTYTWRDEDERLIDDADEKREYIKQWFPDLPTVNGWISIDDRLPERYVNVLTCDIHGNIHENWLYKADPECWSRGYNITHWMPLPEPPEEVGGDA